MIFYTFLEPGVFLVKILCSVFTSVNPVYLLVPQIAPLAYEASNHAILGVAKATARELGQYGIRVNCVSPYGIATPIVCKTYGCDADPLESSITGHANLKGVTLSTKHIAEAALFLASDESAYVSAHNLSVDGGLSSIMQLK
ncbi:Short-chain dehydrogenase reductase 2a [Capsicum chinense]|nr:Short-chain dehydrogenase reductase 2a [Capsicum chinense]